MIKQHTEKEILAIVEDMGFEPDMLDILEDNDGDIIIEGRGDGRLDAERIGYIDDGIVTFF